MLSDIRLRNNWIVSLEVIVVYCRANNNEIRPTG